MSNENEKLLHAIAGDDDGDLDIEQITRLSISAKRADDRRIVAAMCLQGLLANPITSYPWDDSLKLYPTMAIQLADALLAALAQEQENAK